MDKIIDVEYTVASPEDYEELVAMADEAFGHTPEENFFRTIQPKLYRYNDTMDSHYIVRENGKIVGTVCAFTEDMDVYGKTVKTCGIGTVCVLEAYRKKGYMKGLMKAAEDAMKAQGVDIALLGGQRQRYEYYGYTPVGINLHANFDRTNARHFFGADAYFGYEFADVEESDTETLDKMFALYMTRPVKLLRKRAKFYDFLYDNAGRPVVITKNGEFCGYARLNFGNNDIGELELTDKNEVGKVLNDIMKFYGSNNVSFGLIGCFEKEKSNFLVLHGSRHGFSHVDSVAVFDFKKTLDAFFFMKEDCFDLVDGECSFAVEGHKPFKITVKNGVHSIEDYEGKADVEMPYLLAVQKMFGCAGSYCNYGVKLPPCAESWFPVPIFFSGSDMV